MSKKTAGRNAGRANMQKEDLVVNVLDQPPPMLTAKYAEVRENQIRKFVNVEGVRRKWLQKIPDHVESGTESYFRIDPKSQRFPGWSELSALPEEVQESIKATALSILHFRLLPVLLMFLRKQTKQRLLKLALSHSQCGAPPTTHYLQTLPCFSKWDKLDEVVARFTPHFFVQDEVIIHEKEKESAAICILTFGNAVSEHDPGTYIAAPSVVGKITTHSQHRQLHFVKAASPECLMWFMTYKVYQELLAKQPPDSLKIHTENTFISREETLKRAYHDFVSPDALQSFAEFDMLPLDNVETDVQSRLVPKVFRPGSTLYKGGDPASTLIYVVQGTVAINRNSFGRFGAAGPQPSQQHHLGTFLPGQTGKRNSAQGLPTPQGANGGKSLFSPSHAQANSTGHGLSTDLRNAPGLPQGSIILEAPCLLGDLSWIQSTKRRHFCIALTTIDTCVITKDSMKLIISSMDTSELLRYRPLNAGIMGLSTGNLPPSAMAEVTSPKPEKRLSGDSSAPCEMSALTLSRRLSGGNMAQSRNEASWRQDTLSKSVAGSPASPPPPRKPNFPVQFASANMNSSLRGGPSAAQNKALVFMKYVPYVRSIPLLSHLLPPEDEEGENPTPPIVQALAEACSPLVFPPKAIVTSMTEVCDKIIFVLGGRAVIQSNDTDGQKRLQHLQALAEKHRQAITEKAAKEDKKDINQFSFGTISPPLASKTTSGQPAPLLTLISASEAEKIHKKKQKFLSHSPNANNSSNTLVLGECIGFPLLSPHKWLRRIIATETVECVQLPHHKYFEILSRFGLKKQVAALSNALLNPGMVSEPEGDAAKSLINHLRNPPMYSTQHREKSELNMPRYPSETTLKRLAPIPLQNRLSTCVFGGASMSRFSSEKVAPMETGATLRPIILGKHNKLHLEYKGTLPVKNPVKAGGGFGGGPASVGTKKASTPQPTSNNAKPSPRKK